MDSLQKGKTYYTSNSGTLELRQEIANYQNRRYALTYDPKDEIIVTVGGSEAIDLAMRACINPGEDVHLLFRELSFSLLLNMSRGFLSTFAMMFSSSSGIAGDCNHSALSEWVGGIDAVLSPCISRMIV